MTVLNEIQSSIKFLNWCIYYKLSWLFEYVQIILLYGGLWFMVFNVAFNNISVLSWRWALLLVEKIGEPGETPRLSQVTDTLYHIMLYRVHLATNYIIGCYFLWRLLHWIFLYQILTFSCFVDVIYAFFARLFRCSFLAKTSVMCITKTCMFCVFTSIREKLWTLDTQG